MSVKPIISAAEAAKFVQDGMTFTTSGFVACEMPESLSKALEKSFLETGHPRDLTLFYAAAQGNRDGSGADHFAHEGMLKRVIGGHYNMVPELGKLIFANKLEQAGSLQPASGYSVPALPRYRSTQGRNHYSRRHEHIL